MAVDAPIALLRWYDSNRRQLPWRALPGENPDPYRVWLSEIMLQQTTVAAVTPYYAEFTRRWPTVQALAAAEDGEVMAAWAGLGYYARARNLIACARLVAARGGFPDDEAGLRALPGIGRYTAAAIAAIAFGRRAVAVDANIERVVARLFAVEARLPAARNEIYRLADGLSPDERCGDFVQAMMDLGATVCVPRGPDCAACPIAFACRARASGRADEYPRKAPRRARPHKQAVAYWLEHDGEVMLVRRPKQGLLGGMLALPTGSWAEQASAGEGAPAAAQWIDAGTVEHVFTHFSISVRLLCAASTERPPDAIWWPAGRIDEAGLPTLFAKLASRGTAWRAAA
jgi:A/G-specific adenine glycosylase